MTAPVIITLALYFVAQLADVVTTLQGLRRGAVETNPVIRWMMDHLGGGWVVLKLALSVVFAWGFFAIGQPMLIWIITALTAYVAWRNAGMDT